MRIFVAIDLTEENREQLARALKPFKKLGGPIRWIPPANFHLTLKFIGETPRDRVETVARALSAIRKKNPDPLVLDFDGFGFFGRDDMIRIFWIRVADHPLLAALYQEVEDRLAGIGIPREERPFFPHLTVGRNKTRFNTKKYREQIAHSEGRSILRQPVSSFCLMLSDLQPGGAKYTTIREYDLE